MRIGTCNSPPKQSPISFSDTYYAVIANQRASYMRTSSIEPIRYLSREEMDAIHQSALHILERTGMWIDHGKALEYLRAAGCRVDMDRRLVKFPPEVVEAAVARMRQNYQDPNRWPKRMSSRYSQVRFEAQPLRVHGISQSARGDFAVSSGTWRVSDARPRCRMSASR